MTLKKKATALQKKKAVPAAKSSNISKLSKKKDPSGIFQKQIQLRKNKVLAALRLSYGVVSDACRAAGITRKTFYEYYKRDMKFKAQADDTEEYGLDHAVKQLHVNIDHGKEASLIFYLKCRGRNRGYIEKGDDAKTVINITSSTDVSPEELM